MTSLGDLECTPAAEVTTFTSPPHACLIDCVNLLVDACYGAHGHVHLKIETDILSNTKTAKTTRVKKGNLIYVQTSYFNENQEKTQLK